MAIDGVLPRDVRGASSLPESALLFAITAILVLAMIGPMMTISDPGAVNILGSLSGEGSSLRQVLYIAAAGIVAYGVRPAARSVRLLAVPWPMLVALAYCWISLTWSIAPGTGARRLVLTTVLIWSIFSAVAQAGYERSLFLLRLVLTGALLANFAAVLLTPGFGIHQANDVLDKNLIGDWRGIMMQKNITSAATAVTVLVFLFDGKRIPGFVRAPVLLASAFMLYKTGSRTSEGMCLGAALIGVVYLMYNARYRSLVLIAGMLVLAAIAAAPNFVRFDKIPNLNDPKTLSGRLDVWQAVMGYSADHRMLGAGYGSFWDIGPNSPVFQYGKGWVLKLAQGHDGYLDLLAAIGLPGLVIVVAAAIVLPLARLLMSRSAMGGRGALVLSVIMFCVGQNATESTLFDRDAISQVLLMFGLGLLVAISPDAGWPLPFGVPGVRRTAPRRSAS